MIQVKEFDKNSSCGSCSQSNFALGMWTQNARLAATPLGSNFSSHHHPFKEGQPWGCVHSAEDIHLWHHLYGAVC